MSPILCPFPMASTHGRMSSPACAPTTPARDRTCDGLDTNRASNSRIGDPLHARDTSLAHALPQEHGPPSHHRHGISSGLRLGHCSALDRNIQLQTLSAQLRNLMLSGQPEWPAGGTFRHDFRSNLYELRRAAWAASRAIVFLRTFYRQNIVLIDFNHFILIRVVPGARHFPLSLRVERKPTHAAR
jgi:hypothetical protein